MEQLILLLLLALGVRAEFPTKEFLEGLKPVIEKCEADTGVDKGLVDQFSKGTMIDDDKLKCYMKCIFLEFQVLDETTGLFRYEKMLGLIPQEMKSVAYEMGRNCIHFKGEGAADLCQVSFDLHRCWQKADPEMGWDVWDVNMTLVEQKVPPWYVNQFPPLYVDPLSIIS